MLPDLLEVRERRLLPDDRRHLPERSALALLAPVQRVAVLDYLSTPCRRSDQLRGREQHDRELVMAAVVEDVQQVHVEQMNVSSVGVVDVAAEKVNMPG